MPFAWRCLLHGWPDLRGRDPVWLGGVDALNKLPAKVDAVASLCRLGVEQVPASGVKLVNHGEVWLVGSANPARSPNLSFVLYDAVDAVDAVRTDGRTVLLHCGQARSRTPTVAALYGARVTGRTADDSLDDILRILPRADPNETFRAELERC